MGNDLNRRFRENVVAVQEYVGENAYTFGRRIFPNSPDQYRVQMVSRKSMGFTLSTLETYARGLHLDPCDLIDPHFNPREHSYEPSDHHRDAPPKHAGFRPDLEGEPGDRHHQAARGARA